MSREASKKLFNRNRYEKRTEQVFCARSKKRVRKLVPTFRSQDLIDLVFEGFMSTLKGGHEPSNHEALCLVKVRAVLIRILNRKQKRRNPCDMFGRISF